MYTYTKYEEPIVYKFSSILIIVDFDEIKLQNSSQELKIQKISFSDDVLKY